ncbi:C4-dicarboxylate ABC transporter substrate-binding protein [Thiorhodococcus mannitoliphagus]|uniref:C4-dicarboxylate ABC transporter substrate-binding protein n=1 Tax=Thiorhodococcus mannitoliphagus TaxID=329406 RepID=A0A6P1DUG1_9GAMM|nr:TAXI family TRAP transporter solute-binding subunit [Thiorhodococcus mannitoliphagus]NEX19335.1 C4-dicarboxylate ABC transporter substrate-binding protein [Thiorhodococcus mannitoliphagus]
MSSSSTKPGNQPKPKKNPWEAIGLFGGSALLVLVALFIAAQYVKPAPPRQVSIATGAEDGGYYRYAEQYRRILARHGITLEVMATSGSLENLELLLDEDAPVDLAFVQGGVATAEQRQALSGLGSMFYEPVWLLAPIDTQDSRLSALQGERIGVGPANSGTGFLATRMLAQSGITEDNAGLRWGAIEKLAEQLRTGDLKLLFMVASTDSPMLRAFVADPGIRIRTLAEAPAYARIDRSLTNLALPAGALDLAKQLPETDLDLIAATANLVARPEIHPALVDLLIEAAVEVHGQGGLLAAPDTFPTPQHSDFPMNSDAKRHYKDGAPFLQRYLPFWAATWIDRTKVMLLPLLALLFPLFKILPPLYAWRIRRRILRWYVELRQIDLKLETGSRDTAELEALAERLERIEYEAAQVEVPLSYSDQLYDLRLHVQLLQRRLRRLTTPLETQENLSWDV